MDVWVSQNNAFDFSFDFIHPICSSITLLSFIRFLFLISHCSTIVIFSFLLHSKIFDFIFIRKSTYMTSLEAHL
jgi:hypothetical protein